MYFIAFCLASKTKFSARGLEGRRQKQAFFCLLTTSQTKFLIERISFEVKPIVLWLRRAKGSVYSRLIYPL